ncbi:hypothetical protein GCM10023196_017010 [Actinoallomurus vinaceus]|uniref:Uncharacterized protein n=1 Tax=Actinoallomurus vinaceus TaxID=1080074 RepID=A0ABP8U3F1_9ACTN
MASRNPWYSSAVISGGVRTIASNARFVWTWTNTASSDDVGGAAWDVGTTPPGRLARMLAPTA